MSKRWVSGSTRAWRKVRTQVLERDAHRCQLRLPGCTTLATQVHHLTAREASGDNPAALVAACRSCNLRVGDPTRHDPAPRPLRWWE